MSATAGCYRRTGQTATCRRRCGCLTFWEPFASAAQTAARRAKTSKASVPWCLVFRWGSAAPSACRRAHLSPSLPETISRGPCVCLSSSVCVWSWTCWPHAIMLRWHTYACVRVSAQGNTAAKKTGTRNRRTSSTELMLGASDDQGRRRHAAELLELAGATKISRAVQLQVGVMKTGGRSAIATALHGLKQRENERRMSNADDSSADPTKSPGVMTVLAAGMWKRRISVSSSSFCPAPAGCAVPLSVTPSLSPNLHCQQRHRVSHYLEFLQRIGRGFSWLRLGPDADGRSGCCLSAANGGPR